MTQTILPEGSSQPRSGAHTSHHCRLNKAVVRNSFALRLLASHFLTQGSTKTFEARVGNIRPRAV